MAVHGYLRDVKICCDASTSQIQFNYEARWALVISWAQMLTDNLLVYVHREVWQDGAEEGTYICNYVWEDYEGKVQAGEKQ